MLKLEVKEKLCKEEKKSREAKKEQSSGGVQGESEERNERQQWEVNFEKERMESSHHFLKHSIIILLIILKILNYRVISKQR